MKVVKLTVRNFVIFAIAISFIGVIPVSATRAVADKGTGCYVRVGPGEGDYVLDNACEAHDVIKFDDDGSIELYNYQDHGQLPEGGWRPDRTFRSTYDQCLSITPAHILVCGTIKETVTPSGEYKSSFLSD